MNLKCVIFKIEVLLLIVFVVSFVFLPGCVVFNDDGSDNNSVLFITFTPDSEEIPPQSFYLELANIAEDIFTINILVKDINDLYGTAFTLTFDPSMLLFLDAAEGGFLKSGGYSTSFMASPEQNYPGRLIIGYTRLGNAPGVSGSGLICTITFKVIREGETALRFDNANAVDSRGNYIEGVSWFGGVLRAIYL